MSLTPVPPTKEFSYPTLSPPADPRPYVPVQFLLPTGKWSQSILFNFDTGASWATDMPPQLLSAFGQKPVASDARREVARKVRLVGMEGMEMTIPVVTQDQAHYDLFKSEPKRKPLFRTRDMMRYASIIYSLDKTTIRPRVLGPPSEIQGGVIMFPKASARSGTPTQGWYWNKGVISGPTGTQYIDWLNVNTGDRRFIMKKSSADRAGVRLTKSPVSGEWDARLTVTYSETRPQLVLSNIPVTVRDDDEEFARGGLARNLCGGPNFLSKYKMLQWDLNLALAPVYSPSGTSSFRAVLI